jgi:Asp-tRNA(Asn)/Glu-tRNA(Gln) amidotransferase A subunit family amidase
MTCPNEAPLLSSVLTTKDTHKSISDEASERATILHDVFLSSSNDLSPLGELSFDLMTVPFSLAGVPALSLPWLTGPAGFPLGVQLIGLQDQDEELLAMAANLDSLVRNLPV